MTPSNVWRCFLCLPLAAAGASALHLAGPAWAQDVVISEFLAVNEEGLLDEDGERSDWIELESLGPAAASLGGWSLTDDPSNLRKWRFPPVDLPAGEFLLVFASGKDRAAAGSQLHANFKLDRDGDYLAVVRPDGSIAHEYAPAYPPQRENVSYGISQAVGTTILIPEHATGKVWVPTEGSQSLTWTHPAYDDAGWIAGAMGVGYDTEDDDPNPPPPEILNLALRGTAVQSSLGYGGLPERAIDGNTDGSYGSNSVTHTADGDPAPYWEVDLGDAFPLVKVTLWNRTDCCSGRLSNFRVRVFVDAEEEGFSEDFFTDGVGFPTPGAGFEIPLPAATVGRFVRVEILGPNATGQTYLSLAEVAVLGDAGSPASGPTNLARGKTATQSTTAFGGFASRAVDGNTNGVYSGNSVSHTSPADPQPFWQVDLGAMYTLDRAVLWNRTDCCAQRLSNFRVSVLDEAMIVTAQSDHFTDKGSPASQDYAVPFPPGTRGRHVKISKLGPDSGGESILALAEVEVFDAPPGYRRLIQTDVKQAMLGHNASAYVRVPFDVADPKALDFLKLRLKYDDGFVAYVNGTEVARRNAPDSPAWDSAATREHADVEAIRYEEINLTDHLGLLSSGRNVLAIQGLNAGREDPDFLILPELEGVSMMDGEPRYFLEPTPSAPNDPEGLLGFVADTQFTVHRGFFDALFEVAIRTETPGAEIRYTTNGSAPTATLGQIYSLPIPVTTTTMLRAAAFKPGFGPTNVDSQTYIFPADVVKQTGAGFPRTWGGTLADYEMDPNVVTNPRYADTIQDDIVSKIPTLSIVMDTADLFGPRGIYSNTEARGDAWERPCSMEIIYPDGRQGLHVNCGIRIFGYGWRSHSASMKHAFRLMFKRKYGPGKLEYKFFPDFPVERFDSLVLRSQGSRGWNDFRTSIEQTCYIRDAWARYSEQAMGKLTTSSTYVHLYLNGLYWGLYNPVERPDAEFMAEHLGGGEESYDALNARVGNIEVIDGSRTGWSALIALARSNTVTSLATLTKIQESLDVTDLMDYTLINFYTGNQDWVGSNGNNMRVAGAPGLGVGYKAFCWDMEYSIWNATDNVLSVLTQYDTPALLYARLKTNPEFRLMFADRVRLHFFHGGALTPEKTAERWLARASEIDRAVVGESARWGDRRREPPYTRDVEWVRERDRLIKSYFPQRTGILLGQLKQAGLYPSLEAPEFSQHGGKIPEGFELEMSAPAGDVLFTLDGTDPREPGGAVSAGALMYQTPVTLFKSARVKARAQAGAVWSALNEATFILQKPPPLRITEIMYHPPASLLPGSFDADDFEFVELKNIGTEPLDLAGFRISGGIDFGFSGGQIGAGGFVLVVKSLAAFQSRYNAAGLQIAGEYGGQLSNGGEPLRLEGSFGETILDFAYDDAWYAPTDGGGSSLEIIDPLLDPGIWGQRSSWRPSRLSGGTPGAGDSTPPAGGFQRPADANQDSKVDLSDAVSVLGHLFLGAPAVLPCGDGTLQSEGNRLLLDSNGDLRVDLADPISVLRFLFLGGPPPPLGVECVRVLGCSTSCNS